MKNLLVLCLMLSLISCIDKKETKEARSANDVFVIAFGSCDNQELPNVLWKEITKNHPDLFIWGGDIIYADGMDIDGMQKSYLKQKSDIAYQNFIKDISLMGTWDDHDYGLNDGGIEFKQKDSVQQLFLDFFDVDASDNRRARTGVYYSEKFIVGKNSIKVME